MRGGLEFDGALDTWLNRDNPEDLDPGEFICSWCENDICTCPEPDYEAEAEADADWRNS